MRAMKMMKSNKSFVPWEQSKTRRKTVVSLMILLSLSAVIVASAVGCRSGGEVAANGNLKAATPEQKVDEFQEILRSFDTAGFKFVFTFRRPDGEPLSSEDKSFLKEYSPTETNRWNLTEDGKTAVAGSNYRFPPESLNILRFRFTVEDYSKPGEDSGNKNSNIDQNSNVNKNSNVNQNLNVERNSNRMK
jgi:hypothetical protein